MVATTINAAVCRRFGEPLVIEEVTLADPGAEEVRVQIAACAICHSDVSFVDGSWGGELPAVWGHEAAGVVVDAGPDCAVAPGDRVVVTLVRSCGTCRHCRNGASVACAVRFPLDERSPLHDRTGAPITHGLRTAAFAEEVVVHASQVVPIPDSVPLASAALLACGVITGIGAVVNTARMEPGASAVVIGCGGIGLNVVQGAALAGAEIVIAVDRSPAKRDLALQLGATHALDAADDVPGAVAAITHGDLADNVFVAAGSQAAIESGLPLVASMGALVLVGMPPSDVRIDIDPGAIAAANQRILGSKMGTTTLAADMPRLVQHYEAGRLRLDELISGRFPLLEINTAIDQVRSGRAVRNVIVFDENPAGRSAHR